MRDQHKGLSSDASIPQLGESRQAMSDADQSPEVSFAPPPSTALKTVGRCLAGWLVGYLISAVTSIAFFLIGQISPAKPASTIVMWITAIYGIVFAVVGAVIGANFCRKFALGIGASIALTIGAMGMFSWYLQPDHAHWSQIIAIFLMAPAAQFGALFRREDY